MNADLAIGDSTLLLNEEFPSRKVLSPPSLAGSSVTTHVYLETVDAASSRAVSAGATVTIPLMDLFCGDRYGQLLDPLGHHWSLATRQEDLSSEEIEKRGQAVFAEMAKRAQHGN